MEQQSIISQLKTLNTATELAELLDDIKNSELGWVKYRISEKMLKHFSSDRLAPKRFRIFHIRKKSGGLREIKAPCRQLDVILTCVNILLKSIYEPSDVAMGFTCGRSVVTNAQLHIGHNYVFNIDLKDFFPSIPQARVWKRLQLPPFNFSQEIANIIAGLCCSYDEGVKANVIPQGSPASPLLTNAICDNLDRRMKGVAKRFGLHYSRYADDMTFSSMHNVYQEGSEFRNEIERIITQQGFRMNESKTRLQKTGGRQEVTGLVVNTYANVSRQYISDLRWILSVWEKEGYGKAYSLFYPKYKKEKGYIKKGEPVMENVIGGKLDYLKMVRGASNPAYQKLAARYAALQELVFVDSETDSKKSYIYVQPYTLEDFESLFHTTIYLEVTREGKLIGKCTIDNRDKILAISKSTQKRLCPGLENKTPGDSIYSLELRNCYVTLCRSKGKNFWLITKFEPKRSRCLSVQNLKVSPKELLTIWEEYGIEKASARLASFIRFAKSGESILDWDSSSVSEGTANLDRGVIFSGREYLIKYFLKNRQLSKDEKRRLMRLLFESAPIEPIGIDIEPLLLIWEKEGLDAAVKAWKERLAKSAVESPKKTQREDSTEKIVDSEISFLSEESMQQEIGMTKESLADLRNEMRSVKVEGTPIGRPFNFGVLPLDEEPGLFDDL